MPLRADFLYAESSGFDKIRDVRLFLTASTLHRFAFLGLLGLSACASSPDANELYQKAVHTLSAEHDAESALDLLDQTLQADPSHVDARRVRAGVYRLLGRPEKALEDCSEVLRRNPKDAAAFLDRARLFAETGHPKEAETDYVSAIKIYPHFLEAYLHRGLMYRNLGRTAEADRDFAEARRLGGEMAAAFHNEAIKEIALGRRDDALRHFSFAVELEPRLTAAYVGRARIFLETGRPREAIRDLDRAIELDPNRADFYLYRGNAHLAAEATPEALADFDRAGARDQNLVGAYVGRGIVHRSRGEWETAEKELTHALEIEPDRADAFLERARAYLGWKLLGDAERDARRSLRLSSTPDGLHLLGVVLLEKGDASRALGIFELALARAKDAALRARISTDLERAQKEMKR